MTDLPCPSCGTGTPVTFVLVPSTGYTVALCPACLAGLARRPKPAPTPESLRQFIGRHQKVSDRLGMGWSVRKIAACPEVKASESTVLKVSKARKLLKRMTAPGYKPEAPAPPAPAPVPRPPAPALPPSTVVKEVPQEPPVTPQAPRPAAKPAAEERMHPELRAYHAGFPDEEDEPEPEPAPATPPPEDPVAAQIATGFFANGDPIPRTWTRDPLAPLPPASADGSPVRGRDVFYREIKGPEERDTFCAYQHIVHGSVPWDFVQDDIGPYEDEKSVNHPYQYYVFDTMRSAWGPLLPDGKPELFSPEPPEAYTRHPVLPSGKHGVPRWKEPRPEPPPGWDDPVPERTKPYTPEEMGIYDPEPEDGEDDGLGNSD